MTHVSNTNEFFECSVCQGFFSKEMADSHVRVCLAGVESKKVTHVTNASEYGECPVCGGFFAKVSIDSHVRMCLSGEEAKMPVNDHVMDVDTRSEARRKEEEENERFVRENFF